MVRCADKPSAEVLVDIAAAPETVWDLVREQAVLASLEMLRNLEHP